MQGVSSISHCVATGFVVSGGRGDNHHVDLVLDDQFLRDFCRAVRIGLAVLYEHLDRIGLSADLHSVLDAGEKVLDDELVRLGESRKRARLRRHIA
jgi:hypothetical protein